MSKNIYEVINKTTKLLYDDKKSVYANLDKIEKRVTRICNKLETNEILDFNTDIYDEDSRAKFFATWIEILDNDIIQGSNRKLLDNICKLDWAVNMDEAYAIFISEEYIEKSEEISDIKIECNCTSNYIEHCKSRLRTKIRYGDDDFLLRYEQTKKLLNNFLENEAEKKLFYYLKWLKITEELFSDVLMQILVYGIANNQEIIVEKREELLKSIKMKIESFEIETNIKEGYGIFDDFAIKLCYLNRRKELMTEVDVVNELIKQNREKDYAKYPLDKFKCNDKIIKIIESKEDYIKEFLNQIPGQVNDYSNFTLEDCQIELEKVLFFSEKRKIESVQKIQELKEIITEGNTKEKTSRFKKKLEYSWDYCDFLQKYAGRQLLPFYLQHIKVIYREIIVDKIKFNNRTTHTIMKDLEERISKNLGNEKMIGHNQESYFVLEKINRGFYREKGNIDMYNYMGDIRVAYYNKILQIYELKNVEEALSCMNKFIGYIDIAMLEELSKI